MAMPTGYPYGVFPTKAGSAEVLLDELPRCLGRPGVGDDLGQLDVLEVAEVALADQHGVVPVEVRGREPRRTALEDGLLVARARHDDGDDVGQAFAGLGVERVLARPAPGEEALA